MNSERCKLCRNWDSNEGKCKTKDELPLPQKLQGNDFDNFGSSAGTQLAMEKSRDFLDGKSSLYLYGRPGLGKTHLCVASFKEAFKRCSVACRFFNVPKMLHVERGEYETREEAELRLVEKILRYDLLYLDDLGAEIKSSKTAEVLYLIINQATEQGKPRLFITGNQPISAISEQVSDRIASRLVGLCGKENIVKLEGRDRR
jgi:DNA replication protein DnaC